MRMARWRICCRRPFSRHSSCTPTMWRTSSPVRGRTGCAGCLPAVRGSRHSHRSSRSGATSTGVGASRGGAGTRAARNALLFLRHRQLRHRRLGFLRRLLEALGGAVEDRSGVWAKVAGKDSGTARHLLVACFERSPVAGGDHRIDAIGHFGAFAGGLAAEAGAKPCLPDTRNMIQVPADLLRRTPETEALIDVEPFVHGLLDRETTRPLLDLLGVRSTPSGPGRLLDRLRALGEIGQGSRA